ncbi:alanine--tRNA ligase [Candidatus Saccharibacteria bacterium]|jgi:alanyl-tRNA synthetase|nr:alanine--tRNA ligase [Candidatus Saccharibacteria bacterium]
MNAQEIRKKYIQYMHDRQHAIVKRAPIYLEGDSTTLFTGSGMQPLLPYLLGETHPKGKRLVDVQTCFRSQDIDDIGDNRHTTFFEMLGNWSLGDYFKEQQIEWFFDFLVGEVGLNPAKIYVTCFIGDEKYGIPKDETAAKIWQKVFAKYDIDAKIIELGSAENGDKLGLQGGRIFFYDDKENWWSRGGGIETTPLGDPCGPDSEVFYDFGETAHDASFGEAHPASDSGRFMEIGNQVFMQYKRLEGGNFEPLTSKNVDFGGGLERIAAAAIDNPDVFKISLLKPIVDKLEELSGKKYEAETENMRVISDHLRASVFLITDGVLPSNKEQGYVLRRLLRRSILKAFNLGIEDDFLENIARIIAKTYAEDYPEVATNIASTIDTLKKEEKIFRQTLRKGLRELGRFSADGLTGTEIFMLHDTYGFPVELSVEEIEKQGIDLSENWQIEFDENMKQQRERSKTASKGRFKGGLEGDSPEILKLHTATHLLNAALHQVLGEGVSQKGSNVTAERLRFDFTWGEKMTSEQIKQVEDMVNEQVEKDLAVTFAEHPVDYALNEMKAIGVFGEKYGDMVKVYVMGEPGKRPFSVEICGGPHVEHTAILAEGGKRFKIKKEQSSSAGVRRIKAVLQ